MKTRRKVVVGIVGAGFAANLHLENYRLVHGVELRVKGVATARPERAEQFAAAHGLERAYPSVEALIEDPEINLVDLCVPNVQHVPLIVRCAEAGKTVACEKPLTGCYGDGEPGVATRYSRREMFDAALANANRALDALARNGVRMLYAENWVYSPGIQKAARLTAQTGGAILRIVGEESHSGTHSAYARQWRYSGGGSLLNKGCHPLGAALYLKYQEGLRRYGTPIRPARVVGAVAALTKTRGFLADEEKFIREGWDDCEDWGSLFLTFDDDTVAQITASDIVLGGIQNVFSVYGSKSVVHANNVPNTSVLAYAPRAGLFGDQYIREKVETTAGWQFTSGDEHWLNGFPAELQDFCEAVADDREPLSDATLARDVVAVSYAAYLSAEEGRAVELTS
ncbi:MAG TPA: Gfo/Idh/MocA family oxidoreductase [Chloroflexota bacterium]|nr:Gfo/Idh/MocA family oxidoreductase [Chloroflexota bacterium]